MIADSNTRSHAVAALCGAALLFLSTGPVLCDVYIIPLVPPPNAAWDDIPCIRLGGQLVAVDTGFAGGCTLTPAGATALGVDPNTGTAGSQTGVGGTVGTVQGATLPPGTNPSGPSTPITPEGQASTTPPMPGTTHIGPLPPGIAGLLGSAWLSQFNWGRVDGYLHLALKSQGAQGNATAVAMATFLGASPAVPAPGPDGRPSGTKNNIIVPTPTKSVPPNTQAVDSGWDLNTHLISGPHATDVPMIIASGLPTSILSEDTAAALGINLASLPTSSVMGRFGMITARRATVTVLLFSDVAFSFSVSAAIPSSTDNPFSDNILGNDVISQLVYWEISESDGTTRFYGTLPLSQSAPSPARMPGLGSVGLVLVLVIALAGALLVMRRVRVKTTR
jgi:hypothetical protein